MHHHMNVIRHNAPFEQLITVTIEVQQGLVHNLGASGLPQHACAVPGILITGDHPVQLQGSRIRMHPSAFQFPFPTKHHLRGPSIRQTKRECLNLPRGIQMRQISPRVPTLVPKSILHAAVWHICQRTGPDRTASL